MPTAWLGAGGDSPTPEQGIATRWKWGRGEKFDAQCLYRGIVFCLLACLLGPLRCGSALLFRVFFVALTLSFVFLFSCLVLSFFLVLLPLFLLCSSCSSDPTGSSTGRKPDRRFQSVRVQQSIGRGSWLLQWRSRRWLAAPRLRSTPRLASIMLPPIDNRDLDPRFWPNAVVCE